MTDEQASKSSPRSRCRSSSAKPRPKSWLSRNPSRSKARNTLRTQDMLFSILKSVAERGVEIGGAGVVEILSDGFGFLRSPQSNYLPGPTTFTSRRSRSGNSACAPATPSKARSKPRKTANAISR